MQPFATPLSPGETGELHLSLGKEGAPGTLRLHLYQSGVGVFSGRGRAMPLTLPCTDAAFLHMVETTPLPQGAS